MQHELTPVETAALCWLYSQSSPVYAFKKNDPDITIIRALVKKRLAKVQKIISHPTVPAIKASCFAITRKGKRYYKRLSGTVF